MQCCRPFRNVVFKQKLPLFLHRTKARPGGGAKRLRDAVSLRRHQRRHRARAAPQRLRGRFPKGADLLWRAEHPQWRNEQRQRHGPAQHRRIFNAGVDAIIVNAAGCGAAMKEYGHLLEDDLIMRTRPKLQFSSQGRRRISCADWLGRQTRRIAMTVTYQDPCHLAHGQGVRNQPRQLLQAISGLKLVEMNGSDRCCGSAGIYNITHAEMSQQLLKERMPAIADTGAEAVVAPNPGCMLQLRYGAQKYGPNVKVYHLMDLLDRAYTSGESSPADEI